MLKFSKRMKMKKIISAFILFCLSGFCFAQQPVKENLRLQQVEEFFKTALIQYFIHPKQLEKESWIECQASIENLVNKFEGDFVEIRIEKAFKSSDVTNYFSPIFVYEDGREFFLPPFKIMQ